MQHTNLTSNQANRRRKGLARGLLLMAVVGAMALPLVGAANYNGAATGVARVNGETVFDNGPVTCNRQTGDGVGGACLKFPTGATGMVTVLDDLLTSDNPNVA